MSASKNKRSSIGKGGSAGQRVKYSSSAASPAASPSTQISPADPAIALALLVPAPLSHKIARLKLEDGKKLDWDIVKEVSDKNTPPAKSLHGNIRPLVYESFVKKFSEGDWKIVLDKKDSGWLIAEHLTTHLHYELQFEVPMAQLGADARYTRTATVPTIPGQPEWSHGQPDGVLSLLLGQTRVPLFYLDFKLDGVMHNFGQLSSYMLQGYKFLKSTVGAAKIGGGLINFQFTDSDDEPMVQMFGCSMSLRDFRFHIVPFPLRLLDTMDSFVGHILAHSLSITPKLPIPQGFRLQLVTWEELSGKLADLPAEAKLVSTQRHTVFDAGDEFVKVLVEPHLTEEFIGRQAMLYKHMMASLGDTRLVAKWTTTYLGPYMWAVRSENAGVPFTPQRLHDLTKPQVKAFLKDLLRFCLIPPLATEGDSLYVVHGDLRRSNVTLDLKTLDLRIIDFEFLGYNGSRLKTIRVTDKCDKFFEITREQRDSDASPTICTNVWQVGLLVSELFLGSVRAYQSIKSITTEYISQKPVSSPWDEEFVKFLMHFRKKMLTEEMWTGRSISAEDTAKTIVTDLLSLLDQLPA